MICQESNFSQCRQAIFAGGRSTFESPTCHISTIEVLLRRPAGGASGPSVSQCAPAGQTSAARAQGRRRRFSRRARALPALGRFAASPSAVGRQERHRGALPLGVARTPRFVRRPCLCCSDASRWPSWPSCCSWRCGSRATRRRPWGSSGRSSRGRRCKQHLACARVCTLGVR